MLSLATFGAGFVTRPIGAVVIGAYADRAGRKPAMLLCFLLIGFSILAMALIPPYSMIGMAAPVLAVLARMTQGFSLGGEIGSNTAFLIEAAPPTRRGFVASWQGASQSAAILVATFLGATLSSVLSPEALDAYGWRVAFGIGFFAVPFGLWMRSNLPETLHEREPAGAEPPASAELSWSSAVRRHWRVLVLGLAMLGGGTIGTYVSNYIVTYAQNTLHMPSRVAFAAQTVEVAMSIPAVLLGGWLSDRYRRRPVNVWSNLALLLLIFPVFWWIDRTRSAFGLVSGAVVLGAVILFNFGSQCAALGESLPRHVRSSAFGTTYSVAIAAFGGKTQMVVTWLIHATGSALAPGWYLLGGTAVAQVAVMLLPESAPRRERSRSPRAQTRFSRV